MSSVSPTPPGGRRFWPGVKHVRAPFSSVTARTHVYAEVVSWADRPHHPVHLSQKILHTLSHPEKCHPDRWSFERRVPTPVNATGIGHEGDHVVSLSPILRNHQYLQPGPLRQSG
jgi:hypothetical protein